MIIGVIQTAIQICEKKIAWPGPVEKVYVWIDHTPVKEAAGIVKIDAPAMTMFQYKSSHCYGQLDIEQTPRIRIHSDYCAYDDRFEVIGEKRHHKCFVITPPRFTLAQSTWST